MNEHFHKLILKNNSSLKKKETIQSMKNTKNHKNSMDKQYRIPKKQFNKLPKFIGFRKKSILFPKLDQEIIYQIEI